MEGIQNATVATRHSADPADISQRYDILVRTNALLLSAAIAPPDGANLPWTPNSDGWNALNWLADHFRNLERTSASTFRAAMIPRLPQYRPDSPDVVLLNDVVEHCIGPGKRPVAEYLTDFVLSQLDLPHLTVCEAGEAMPNSRTFNSVLPLLASTSYDYGRFGRTLLLHGACTLFRGQHLSCSDSRRNAFETVMFSFRKNPSEDNTASPSLTEFDLDLDKLGIYEL